MNKRITQPEHRFLRISQDTIVNADDIVSICRYWEETHFSDWLKSYNNEKNNYIDRYKKSNPDYTEEDIKKIEPMVHDRIIKVVGPKPDLHAYTYYLELSNNSVIEISEHSANVLCKALNIDINEPVVESYMNDDGGDVYVYSQEMEEAYNKIN